MSPAPRTIASPSTRKLLLAVHIGCVASWMGATVAMTFLSVIGLMTDNQELRRSAYLLMSRMDTGLIVPVVIVSILSGFLLALRTPWGLFRYRWVMAKMGIAVAMVAFAVSTVMPWVQELAAGVRTDALSPILAERGGYLTTAAFVFLAGAPDRHVGKAGKGSRHFHMI